jgi:hypothetical protein
MTAALRGSAEKLLASESLPSKWKPHLQAILEALADWETAELDDFQEAYRKAIVKLTDSAEKTRLRKLFAVRERFRAVSRQIVRMAGQIRGESGEMPITHFFCPMVPGGQGDWLQPGIDLNAKALVNPYWGSQMPHCGEKAHELPAARE